MTASAGRPPAGGRRPGPVHATALVVRDKGVIIRGPSGSGKSTVARRLLDLAERDGHFARLVADDRVILDAAGGRLLARPVPGVAGRLEIRGIGIVSVSWEPACRLHLVVDLGAKTPRLPDEDERWADLWGVRLARLGVGLADAAELVMWRLRGMDDTLMTEP